MACWARMHACAWQGYDDKIRDLMADAIAGGHTISPFMIMAFGLSNLETLLWNRAWAETFMPPSPNPLTRYDQASVRSGQERIRIGYLSADFRGHATAALVSELFRLQDRDRFELFGYNIGRSDGTDLGQDMATALDHMVDLCFLHRSRSRRTDRGGRPRDPGRSQRFHHRQQARHPGPPAGTDPGQLSRLPEFDGNQDDRLHRRGCGGGALRASALLRRGDRPPAAFLPAQRPTSPRHASGRVARRHGLPETGFVFCCFNNNYKLTPLVFDIWMRLLKAVPGRVLWLLQANNAAADNLRAAAWTGASRASGSSSRLAWPMISIWRGSVWPTCSSTRSRSTPTRPRARLCGSVSRF